MNIVSGNVFRYTNKYVSFFRLHTYTTDRLVTLYMCMYIILVSLYMYTRIFVKHEQIVLTTLRYMCIYKIYNYA